MFLHELPDVKELFLVVSDEKAIHPSIVEKDYWVMHTLWGLQQQGFEFELKGGTSLSKGYKIIDRFSEDIDIQIHPAASLEVKSGKNHDKKSHIESRRNFFDTLSNELQISGLLFQRDHEFDDLPKMRSAGIRGTYQSLFPSLAALKEGVLLEVGFDKTTPYDYRDISSWAYEKAITSGIKIINNQANGVKCYLPEYTFIEKLQTISTKYRVNKQRNIESPINFIRHYYDVYQLLQTEQVKNFLSTDDYYTYKQEKFGILNELDLTKNPAFQLSEPGEVDKFSSLYQKKVEIYFGDTPPFEKIIEYIKNYVSTL
ncbi:nucleotidyl transferase AbiEii/AbiGii toxin family protein [Legionella bozemanae]|uniref:nucleotidyl transferase AbiEii/AbiGii toxin family protein n=1 Tax=Legionella bozemanae TaxID=447 RepID=UPI003EEE4D32